MLHSSCIQALPKAASGSARGAQARPWAIDQWAALDVSADCDVTVHFRRSYHKYGYGVRTYITEYSIITQ